MPLRIHAWSFELAARVGRDEGRRADRQEILGLLLVVEQLRARHTHDLDGAADKADIVDVARPVGAGAGEAYPGGIGLGLGEDAAPERRRQIVADRQRAAHDAMRLGVAAALVVARRPVPAHVFGHRVDDALQVLLFAGLQLLLGDADSLVASLEVDQILEERRDGLAQHGVERRAEERLEAAFDMQQGDDQVMQSLPEHRRHPSSTRRRGRASSGK